MWGLHENASRRPINWTSSTTETAKMAHDGRDGHIIELLLSVMDVGPKTPLEQHLLFDPKFWIGDTAATVHLSPQEAGLENMKNPKEAIKAGNGKLIVAKKTGDILGEKMRQAWKGIDESEDCGSRNHRRHSIQPVQFIEIDGTWVNTRWKPKHRNNVDERGHSITLRRSHSNS
jgi:hypothetical protein